MAVTLIDRVSGASALVGLLLVLVTLFTSEQARAFDVEQARTGGARAGGYQRIALIAAGLAVVTLASVISLGSLALAVLSVCCGSDWDPVLSVFVIVWLLLIPLLAWQFGIAMSAWRLRR